MKTHCDTIKCLVKERMLLLFSLKIHDIGWRTERSPRHPTTLMIYVSLCTARGCSDNSIQDRLILSPTFIAHVPELLRLVGPTLKGINTHFVYFIHYLEVCQGVYYC